MPTFYTPKHAFARERLTVTNAVKTLTAATYDAGGVEDRATGAQIVILSGSGAVAYTEDGTAPTADITTVTGVGMPGVAGDVITLESYAAVVNFKAIRITTDAILEVVYYRG